MATGLLLCQKGFFVNIRKSSAKSTVFQIVVFLVLVAGLILYFKEPIAQFYLNSGISKTGFIINGIIIVLFLVGMIRILMTLFRYIQEHHATLKMADFLKNDVSNPTSRMSDNSLILQRYKAVQWVTKQGAPVNQAAMASSFNATENTRLTTIRFVHSTLILAGVFGTVVSLSMALIGAGGLLGSPEGVKEMGTIVGGMSSALSSTITAIFCFFIFAYFYMRLNDSRIQLLNNIEDVTSLYMLPKVSHTEESMVRQVTNLTAALNDAADKLIAVEHTFMNAGLTLQNAVNDLHGQISEGSVNEIKDLIRKGFHLSEPKYDSQDANEKNQEGIIEKRPANNNENLLADAQEVMGADMTADKSNRL